MGLVTSQQYAKEKANLDRGRVGRETALEQANIDNLIAKKNLAQEGIDKIVAGGDIATPAAYQNIQDLTSLIDAQSASLKAVNGQKLNAIDLNEKLADKMTGFSKIVENSFQSMADALADFARTGKLDFKALVDQMLVDLIRFELRAQMSSLYSGMGGLNGMMGMLTGKGTPGSNSFVGPLPENMLGPLVLSAKGGVYDAGLKTFAKGGMFTNSVVNQPTLFKFAQGTGLMGEAGPEAIMPLKRDSQGNLGVRANQQQNVEVVVNNYGSEKATTKESVNNRGERKIEVVIGDAIAGEISRPGSAVQQSLSSNFGNRPAVARR